MITCWKNNFLSQPGCEILIKTVLKALSVYSMSVFRLPNGLCKEIFVLLAKFQHPQPNLIKSIGKVWLT